MKLTISQPKSPITKVTTAIKLLCIAILALTITNAKAVLPTELNGNTVPSLAPMLKKTTPSIVAISGLKKIRMSDNPQRRNQAHPGQRQGYGPGQGPGPGPAPYGNGYNPMQQNEDQFVESIGSGVIIDAKQGYILTNAHVVAELDEIRVMLSDSRKFDAKLLGIDRQTDLALIQVQADNLKQITFSNSDELQVGDFVVAIGNPYGFTHTVTSGIVSALGRSNVGFDGYFDFIQTDAAINIGNSGGGLLNLKGELVGINTAIISPPQGGSVGLGFAIPANIARNIMLQLANDGTVKRGPLGVIAQNLSPELAEGFGLKTKHGAVLTQVFPNTPAFKARLRIGDVVTKVNNKEVLSSAHLRTMISMVPPGSVANCELYRQGVKRNFKITIENPADSYEKAEKFFSGLKGAYLEETPREYPIQGLTVAHIEKDSPIAHYGLRIGDIIVGANQKLTPNSKKLSKAAKMKEKMIVLQVIRHKDTFFVAIKKQLKKESS